jgi:hypothetical protein
MSNSKMSYLEEVNAEICQKLAKLSFKQFIQFYETSEKNECGEGEAVFEQYKMLVNYCNLQIKNNYKLNIDYKFANNKENGRIFVKQTIGLQRIWNKFRGILCDNITIDLDMANAHPTILLYICKIHNIECESLENYVNSRKFFIDSVVKTDKLTKDQAKILFICSMNDEEPVLSHFIKRKEVLYKNENYIKYDNEMKLIQSKIYDLYPVEVKEIEKKTKVNVKGKLLNSILCKYENEILQKAIVKLNIMDCQVQVPMFDGCMVKNNNNLSITTIIDNLNELTKEYNIKWTNKMHNVEILDKLNEMTFDDNVLCFFGNDEVEVANYILETLLKNKLFNCKGEKFLYNKPIWINKDIETILYQILTPHNFYIVGGLSPNCINKDTSSLNSLITMILKLCPNKTDFYKIMHKDTKHRLFYNNGYYDFKQSKFIDYDNDNIPFTTFVIERDYIPNDTLENEVYKRIFFPIFDIDIDIETNEPIENEKYKQMQYSIYQLSRKLAGHIEDKTWMFFLGGRNSGKGLIERSLSNTFSPYVNSFNSSNLISKKTLGEISKELAWMVDFEFTRLIFGSEIDQQLDKYGNNIIKFNGRLIKSIMSGGDDLECRTNNKDARKFPIQSSIILCANDIPLCEPADALEFMQRVDMPCRFINDDMFNNLTEGEKKTFIRRYPDADIKNWILLDEVKQAIETIMFKSYKTVIPMPEDLIKNTNSNDGIISADAKLFEIFKIDTNTVGYSMPNDKIIQYLARHHIAMSITKAIKILKANGATSYRSSSSRGLGCIEYIGGDDC